MGHIEPNLSRRQFVVAGLSAAGGLMLGVSFPNLAAAMPLSTRAVEPRRPSPRTRSTPGS